MLHTIHRTMGKVPIFGMNLGTAFQLIDDLLDYKAVEKDLGKMTGDDFKEGKITLPIILALRRSNNVEKFFGKKQSKMVKYFLEIFKKHAQY